jgi:hypothetical protein
MSENKSVKTIIEDMPNYFLSKKHERESKSTETQKSDQKFKKLISEIGKIRQNVIKLKVIDK